MSQEKPFPFELLGVVFTNSVVKAIKGYSPDAANAQLTPKNEVNVQADQEGKRQFWCGARTVYNAEQSKDGAYYIEIECLARFRVIDDEMSDEEAKRGITITGHNVTFGAIREAVSWITSRHVHGPLLLGLSVLRTTKAPEAKADDDSAASDTGKP